MPEGTAPSRLHEVKCPLLSLGAAKRHGLLVLSLPAGGKERRAA
jgi:hypothetical protein